MCTRSITVGQHCQRLIADLPAVAERTVKHRTPPQLSGEHLAPANLDARMPFQLIPAQLVELCGRATIVTEQPTDSVRSAVALPAGVDHQGTTSRPAAQHERGTQSRGTATDDHAFPIHVHGSSVPAGGGNA